MFLTLLLSTLVVRALSHATMVSPNPRGQDGNLWYQVGCQIGCTCSGASSKQLYVTPSSFGCDEPMEPTNNDASTRTWNVNNKSPGGDYAKYNPWRAPGHAIPLNGCGIASGFLSGGFERIATGGQKTFYQSAVPSGYNAGDPGTKIPSIAAMTTWIAGATAEVMFSIDVNHGGGYQYRLCPKSSGGITEDCFQQNPLAFATTKHMIRYSDGSREDFEIPAVDVTQGVKPAGAAWRRFPVPACNCDLGTGCAAGMSKGNGSVAYEPGTPAAGCATALQFPKAWDEGFGYYGPNREEQSDDGTDSGKDGGSSKDGKQGGSMTAQDSACLKLNQDACEKDAKCAWTLFEGKGDYCWGASGRRLDETLLDEDEDHDHHPGHNHRMLAVGDGKYRCPVCGYIYDPAEHGGKLFDAQPSTFTCPVCRTVKSRFRPASEYVDELGRAPANGYRWHIVDKVVVPNTPGEYVLSWRWDCEQTPQIWSNCADITIVDNKTSTLSSAPGEKSTAAGSTNAYSNSTSLSTPSHSLFSVPMMLMLSFVSHM